MFSVVIRVYYVALGWFVLLIIAHILFSGICNVLYSLPQF